MRKSYLQQYSGPILHCEPVFATTFRKLTEAFEVDKPVHKPCGWVFAEPFEVRGTIVEASKWMMGPGASKNIAGDTIAAILMVGKSSRYGIIIVLGWRLCSWVNKFSYEMVVFIIYSVCCMSESKVDINRRRGIKGVND